MLEDRRRTGAGAHPPRGERGAHAGAEMANGVEAIKEARRGSHCVRGFGGNDDHTCPSSISAIQYMDAKCDRGVQGEKFQRRRV